MEVIPRLVFKKSANLQLTIFSNFVLNFPTLYFRGLKFSNFVDFKLLEHFENYFKESVWNEFYELVGDKYIKGELKKLQARMKETSQWNQPPKPKEAEDQKKSAKVSVLMYQPKCQ